MCTGVWLKMDIIHWIEQKITIEHIVEYISIILVALVSWCFWGKSHLMEKIGGLSKKQEEHVDKVVEQARKEERENGRTYSRNNNTRYRCIYHHSNSGGSDDWCIF